MTPLEIILMVLCVLWLVVIKALDGSLTQAEAERDYLRRLYAATIRQLALALAQRNALMPPGEAARLRAEAQLNAAVAQLEAVTADRDGWRRLVATVRDGRK